MSQEKETVDPGFTIIVDTAEQDGWTFNGILSDADKGSKRFYPRWMRRSLGRHPHSLGDYSIAGAFGMVAIERKSKEDAWGTLLGWPTGWESDRNLPGRRDRFERELSNLNAIENAIVIVEATLTDCVKSIISWGKKSEYENGKIFYRTVLSYQQRFPRVQWMFLDDRRWAETYAFRYLHRFYRKNKERINENNSYGRGAF